MAIVFGLSGAAALTTGRPLVWPPTELTLSEAVALRDRGEVIRQIMLGVDPNRRYQTHDVFRELEDVALTPLEAAVITRESSLVSLLLESGASINDGNATTLQCLANDVREESLRRYIVSVSKESDCRDVPLPWRLN